ncbi:bifunctional DNA-formamidopyrimidine glycosylase/DNA-(apurinic or apyrimidinic site) lyase [Aquisalinus flavus]|uniref:Formamidopyrimidine-DNA glycosylase n=1 Tax=Aquisalinus flavus TaxID=1526572 RepID=A0A8J2V5J3_9PROT|nr:bifunctional DNA-formamidopyrimidine glycosylase/DNA-(apurinic or apyrimidinic site) lyase [Aquisalinus flavus]MBD0425867.1 bifunctional DNA-formamidopyrimidine glycosylase/DNA-(apurinic or apyrimidinic site) lyase [Aquisalinus flavus]UNE48536.1 bifunctional DNA-formamidopyrimidine glycosylase/DNA-(apurinic or apyrimidinic site) lyase [Aquisalinus flavus]GGD12617.1 formamidopyrimidine-DNA glycosylase [Aquisalinus flavus]
MPELPEVETVRRGLAPVMEGATIVAATNRRADLRFAFPDHFSRRLTGWRVASLDRRAKYLLAHLTSGETLVMHLGMSGRFRIEGGDETMDPGRFHHQLPALAAHDHVVFQLAGPAGAFRVTYNDARRFGFMDLLPGDAIETSRHFATMGPEPLGNDFSGPVLAARLKGKATPIKQALLDQRVVAGLGNIYVCEALYRAGISPRRKAGTVAGQRAERLAGEIRQVLSEAIEAGGSSLRDHAGPDGALGYFQHTFRVYDREGRPCGVCGGAIARLVQSGRSTFFCGACQR